MSISSKYMEEESIILSPLTSASSTHNGHNHISKLPRKNKRPNSKARSFIPENKSRLWNYDPNSTLKARRSSHPLLDRIDISDKKKLKKKTKKNQRRTSLASLQKDRAELLKHIETARLPPRPYESLEREDKMAVSLSHSEKYIFEQFVNMIASHNIREEREWLLNSAWNNVEEIALLNQHRSMQSSAVLPYEPALPREPVLPRPLSLRLHSIQHTGSLPPPYRRTSNSARSFKFRTESGISVPITQSL